MSPRLLIVALLSLFAGMPAPAAVPDEHPVTVKWTPPRVTRHEFNPKRPPARMPKLTPPEAGVCHFEFTCDAGMGFLIDETKPGTVEAEVDAVDMELSLPIDIWVQHGAPAKLRQHEEGHRQICEDYYRGCAEIARELGRKMIGRKAVGTGRNKQEAQNAAQQKLLSELNDAFLQAVRVPCRICQDHYDDITVHGLKSIPEAEAIAQAKVMQKEGKVPSVGLPVFNPERTPAKG